MKKILSLALSGMMLLSSLAASVSAADAEPTKYTGDENNGWVQTVNAYALPTAPTFDFDAKGNPTSTTLKEKGVIDTAVWGEPTVVAKASEANTYASTAPNNNQLFVWEQAFEDKYKEDKKTATNTPDGAWSKLEYKLWLRWDNDNFYIAAEIKDPDGYSLLNGSASIWDGDALQFMIDPVGPNGVMKYADFNYDYTKTHFDWWTYKAPWSNQNCMLNLGVGDVTGLKRNRYQVVNMAATESGTIMNDPKSERGIKLNIVNANENTANPGVTVLTLALPWNEIVDTASFAGNLGLENFGAGYTLGMSATVLNAADPATNPGATGKWNSYLNWGSGVTGASMDTTAPWFPYVNPGSNAVVLSDKSALDNSVTVENMRQAAEVKPVEHVDQVMYFDLADGNNNLSAADVANSTYNAEAGFATAADFAICDLDPVDNTRSLVGYWIGSDYSVYAGYDITTKQFVLAQQDTSNGIKRDNIYKRSDKTYEWQVADEENSKPAEWGRLGLVQTGDTVKLYFNGELVLEDTNAIYGHDADGNWLLNRTLIMYNSAAAVVDNWVMASTDYNFLAGEEAKATTICFNYNFDTDDQGFNASPMRGLAEKLGVVRTPYDPENKEGVAYYADRSAVSVTPGEVNGDGKINAKDISDIMKHMLGKTPEGFIEAAADYNSDGSINAKDITAIMKAILNG